MAWSDTPHWFEHHAATLETLVALLIAALIVSRALPAAIRHAISRGGLLSD